MAVHAIMFVAVWWLAVRIATPGRTPRGVLWVIVAFGVLFRLTLIAHDPVASDDIYRYLWDGTVAAHGINPFAHAPSDPALEALHTRELPARVNFPEMRTIYPPMAQAVFLLSSLAFGDSLPALKLILVLFDCATIGLLVALLRTFAIRRTALLLYAWSPFPVLYFALDGHVDALGIPFLLLMLLLAARSRPVGAAFALAGAVLAKLHPLVLAPMLARLGPPWRALFLMLIPLLVLLAASLPYLEPTGGLTESLLVYGATWEFNGSVFWLLKVVLGSSHAAHLASGVALLLWVGYVFLLARPFAERVFLVLLGFFLLAPVVHPWYLSWLAVLVPLRRSVALMLFLGLSILSAVVVYQYQLTGLWQENVFLLLIEYLPVYALLAVEFVRGEFSREESLRRFPLTAPRTLAVKT
jgi:alpha-1,6-mannosyltransferase